MSALSQTKVQIRMSEDEKASLIKAAHRSGFKSLSEFIRVSAHEKARRDLREFPESSDNHYQTPIEPTKLSPADSSVFVDHILNPREPNAVLKALFSKDNEEILKALEETIEKKSRNL